MAATDDWLIVGQPDANTCIGATHLYHRQQDGTW
jgi:hypothetical protein